MSRAAESTFLGGSPILGAGVSRPRLLDLFCGGGGAGMGYHRAGFEVVGVDINRQGNYPFEFIQADCLTLDPAFVASFDAIHASPPCQAYTRKAADWGRKRTHWTKHPDLVEPTRGVLIASGRPYVIENVVGAPVRADLVLCGSMFGLSIIKHRCFELSFPVACLLPSCNHAGAYNPWQGKGRSAEKLRAAQGIDWLPMSGGASRKNGYTGDLFNAIPPAYTKFIGEQLLSHLRDATPRVTASRASGAEDQLFHRGMD
jgi:DNA (cytosine-5)-methyltransferase 1